MSLVLLIQISINIPELGQTSKSITKSFPIVKSKALELVGPLNNGPWQVATPSFTLMGVEVQLRARAFEPETRFDPTLVE